MNTTKQESVTRACSRCGQEFETTNARLKLCPTCRARGRRSRGNGGNSGGRRPKTVAQVLARASAAGGNGNGAVSVNASHYIKRRVVADTITLEGDESGMLTRVKDGNGWRKPTEAITLRQMAKYLVTQDGYTLTGLLTIEGRIVEATLTRGIVIREVAAC